MRVVLMVGGKGTRIASVNSDVPKPMIPICGKPVLQWEVEALHAQGYNDLVMVTGHLGHVIRDYFGDGSRFGVSISYFNETEPLGTAGSLVALRGSFEDDFFLLNGDAMIDMDFKRMESYHRAHGGLATIATHPNSHPYDSSIVVSNNEGVVTHWYNREDDRPACRNRVNAGVHILSPQLFDRFYEIRKLDLDREILKPLVKTGRLISYETPEYIKDMGTPERYKCVCNEVAAGKPREKNLAHKQKAVFLDRDGTLNVYKGFITSPSQIELIDGVADALQRINESGYLAIVVTNQPVVARGECTIDELDEINATLEKELGDEGAYINDLFYCPHHPDRGFAGERPEYKIECDCRKPKPGLLLRAAEKYNIDLSQSYMVGDGSRDIEAGKRAGCNTYLVGPESGKTLQDFCAEMLSLGA